MRVDKTTVKIVTVVCRQLIGINRPLLRQRSNSSKKNFESRQTFDEISNYRRELVVGAVLWSIFMDTTVVSLHTYFYYTNALPWLLLMYKVGVSQAGFDLNLYVYLLLVSLLAR